jgi:hypothetical protein
MSHFYGTLAGCRGEATRCGSKESGITTHAASWDGAVRARVYDRNGVGWTTVELVPWHGSGKNRLLYDGPVSGKRRNASSNPRKRKRPPLREEVPPSKEIQVVCLNERRRRSILRGLTILTETIDGSENNHED